MSQSQPKKQKTGETPNSPIIFKKAGYNLDIYFHIFGQEFHVNFDVLKMNCGFFRTFLEPSGGLLPYSTSPKFTGEWFTCIENKDGKIKSEAPCSSWILSSDHIVSS
jgi:hypothetical protein